MSAGKPDWSKLAELGKLPKASRGRIPLLGQLDKLEEKIYGFRGELCETDQILFDKVFHPQAQEKEIKKKAE